MALTKKNVLSAFAATGVHPLKSEKILDQLKGKTSSFIFSDSEMIPKTSDSVRNIRRTIKTLRAEKVNINTKMNLIIRANEKLIIRADILKHENAGLCTALINEKRRKKRGKFMSLFDKKEPGQAIFFSSAKIAIVRARQEELETQKQQEKLDKETARQNKVAKKEKKLQEIRNQREKKLKIRIEKTKQKERKNEDRKIQNQLNQEFEHNNQIQKKKNIEFDLIKKKKQVSVTAVEEEEPKRRTMRNGRVVAVLTRFQN